MGKLFEVQDVKYGSPPFSVGEMHQGFEESHGAFGAFESSVPNAPRKASVELKLVLQ